MKCILFLSLLGATGVIILGGTALTRANNATLDPAAISPAQPPKQPPQPKDVPKAGVHLTVYEDFALVKDRRELPDEFKKGINIIQFRDVAATLVPTSVHFRSLTDPDAVVQEQSYEFDLVHADKLLQKYIDQKITAHIRDGKSYEGFLLSFDNQRLVLAADKDKGPIVVVERGANIKRIQFSKLPEGLLTRPTLVWEIEAKKPGKHLVEVSYIANQMRWRADYNLVVGGDDKTINLSGWVTIENNSGVAFPGARVKLLAGDTTPDPSRMHWGSGPEYYKIVSTPLPTGKAGPDPSQMIGDYRIYTLPEPTTVANNQIKQIELMRANKVPFAKTYLYDGAKVPQWYRSQFYGDAGFGTETNKKVNVLLEVQNRQDDNLGISLPRGKMRAYKQDADGAMEFIGEDWISHTARDEKLVLYIGDAFDIVGERKQVSFTRIDKNTVKEEFEIRVRNHKKEEVTVKVMEKLYRGSEWRIFNNTQPMEPIDSRTVIFPVRVPADKEAAVRYQVEYKS
jgi:hypothetical protein